MALSIYDLQSRLLMASPGTRLKLSLNINAQNRVEEAFTKNMHHVEAMANHMDERLTDVTNYLREKQRIELKRITRILEQQSEWMDQQVMHYIHPQTHIFHVAFQ